MFFGLPNKYTMHVNCIWNLVQKWAKQKEKKNIRIYTGALAAQHSTIAQPIAFSETCFPHNAYVHQFSEWTPVVPFCQSNLATLNILATTKPKNEQKNTTYIASSLFSFFSFHFTSIHLLDLLMGNNCDKLKAKQRRNIPSKSVCFVRWTEFGSSRWL